MMGHRGNTNGVGDDDAFDRRARQALRWRRGQVRKIKRAYAKRQRKAARALSLRDAAS